MRTEHAFESLSQRVAHEVPYLRRYARALTGAQKSGDAYVAATLEALVDDPPATLVTQESIRIGLYRLFTRIWTSLAINAFTEAPGADLPVEARLAQLTPQSRQAFLLVALEGFPEEAAARILDIGVPALRGLIENSGRELAAEIATDVMIIEDEPLIAIELQGIVEALGHRVLGVARTHAQAVMLATESRPGVILADIQLADGSWGLEAVNELLLGFEVPVIFVTAFPERFLTGARPEPAFLISKPFQRSTISAVLSQALFFEHKAHRGRHAVA